jgi:dimethylargininase
MIAFTRDVASTIQRCELTHVAREPIDVQLARQQHEAYEGALRDAGLDVRKLPPRDDLPDSVFVEDTAVVLDEVAVITRPGASCRRDETESVRGPLAEWRSIATIEGPGTLDGGDVLILDRDVLVGLTPRTNLTGMQQLRSILAPFGYTVRAVPVRGCLHLKTAITRAGTKTVVANPSFVDPALVPGWDVVPVDAREPFAGNVLWLGATTIVAEGFARTNATLARATDSALVPVPASELAKAEGGVTCCSLILTRALSSEL